MERSGVGSNHYNILSLLNCLPKKMLSLHGTENMPEFVLHELCTPSCFNIKNAAYFVDNPDFNCFKGVAGFCSQEAFDPEKVWSAPDEFSKHMQQATFNQKVRAIAQPSQRSSGKKDEEMVGWLSQLLGITNPSYCSWNMKHDNHGLLIYEKPSCEVSENLLQNGVCLLGFCPIH